MCSVIAFCPGVEPGFCNWEKDIFNSEQRNVSCFDSEVFQVISEFEKAFLGLKTHQNIYDRSMSLNINNTLLLFIFINTHLNLHIKQESPELVKEISHFAQWVIFNIYMFVPFFLKQESFAGISTAPSSFFLSWKSVEIDPAETLNLCWCFCILLSWIRKLFS